MGLQIVILAAGQGKRMRSSTPKVLHHLGGISLLERVLHTAQQLNPDTIYIVYGKTEGERIRRVLADAPVCWVEQPEPLGTGHAVLQVLPFVKDKDQVLVLYGDVPLITVKTLQRLLRSTGPDGIGLIVAKLKNPTGFGRMIRHADGQIVDIIEERDATPKQRMIDEVNAGIIVTKAQNLQSWLPRLSQKNSQQEYYLTDVIKLGVADGQPIQAVLPMDTEEILGVNHRLQLVTLARFYQRKLAEKWLLSGITIMDPDRFDIRSDDVRIGKDTVIDINVVLLGRIRIGSSVIIGPNVVLKDVTIQAHTEVLANSVLEGVTIGQHCRIGPFARLRPDTVLAADVHIGNFVEVKNSTLQSYSKANHLTYLGDSDIGQYVNIGAGTITCNYDGVKKWKTTIKRGAFIGSNVALVAPLTVYQGATVGAGSTITADVPAQTLTLSRGRQTTIKNWQKGNKN